MIKEEYDDDFERKCTKTLGMGIVFGAISEYDSTWETHRVLKEFLRRRIPAGVKLPIIVPGKRLKTGYFTKKRYLRMVKRLN